MYTIRFELQGSTHTLSGTRESCHAAARAIAHAHHGVNVSVWKGESCTHSYLIQS